ncbi:hypothetical protein GWI33_010865 [Rhynchophorus ferrugineus]|uniref:Uncharacterized protein n=1 Tax=Rhynchophorus ferrugineus TaxID=354439 RepID=A0A834I903_RHYFE|nr:hypothetical protein GWI33_010865 [Rhynchophorus ferrugineus]
MSRPRCAKKHHPRVSILKCSSDKVHKEKAPVKRYRWASSGLFMGHPDDRSNRLRPDADAGIFAEGNDKKRAEGRTPGSWCANTRRCVLWIGY